MSKFSRLVAIATILALVFTLGLSGCGQEKEGTSSEVTKTTEPAKSTASEEKTAPLPEVKLTWYFPGAFPAPDQEQIFAEANKLIKAKINATVDFKPFTFGDYPQKMQVVIASGDEYDLCFTSDWLNNYVQNVSKGAFLPLDDLMAQYAPKAFASIPAKMWEATKVKGKIYGFINYQISARTPDVVAPKELLDKYGFDLKTVAGKLKADTLPMLEPYLAAVTKDYPQKSFQTNFGELGGQFFDVDAINGWNIPGVVAYSDTSLKVVNQFELPQYRAYAKLMREWNAKGYLNSRDRISKKTDDWWSDAKAGKIAMIMGGTYKPGVDVVNSANAGYPMVDVPAGTNYLTTGGIIATMHAINRNSKNPERAMMLLEYLNTDPEIYNLLVFGIKDQNYTVDAEGYATRVTEGSHVYNTNSDWMFATNFLALIQKGQPKTVWEDTKKFNESAQASPLLGFNFDPANVTAEIGRCSTVVDEYIRAIELGVSDEAKYDEFLAKLKTAGSEKIMAEMQKQINDWKATK